VKRIKRFDHIHLKLASPERIRAWSYGEVKKPETINYRTLRPERDGLFCERIFGTTKEWECYCGKFKSIRYKGVVCDRCGVEVTHFRVRRERMGHIELAAPVAHIWFYRSVPSRIGLLLDVSGSALRSVLYYEKFIVTDPGESDLEKKQLLTEEEYEEACEQYGMSFSADMGAEAIRALLNDLDVSNLVMELRTQMEEKGLRSDKRLLKRIEIAEQFSKSGNHPSWMIFDVIPVIPPELRPMVQLDGGRFATSDLNDLYRRIINRNNRLRRLKLLQAPDIIIRNEKRMLQEAFDALIDNSKKQRVVKNSISKPLRSLSDMLRGKQGRFRQNLLGKRVDYSGRSVIVAGPELELHQCGLPTKMALELYKPFIMKRLVEEEVVFNLKKAKALVEQEAPEVFAILEEVVQHHPVLLNRAPTLHRLGIQAFMPVLVDGKAIRLHPLVCHAYNADFDGDQMAVHVPLSQAAQTECVTLMLSSRNLLNPANGQPIVFPSHEMVLGVYYLTGMKKGAKGEGRRFSSFEEVRYALDYDVVDYHALIKIKIDGKLIETTPGRIIFNEELPEEVPFINQHLKDEDLQALIADMHKKFGQAITVKMLDIVKKIGFKYATFFGCTLGLDDIIIPEEKPELLDKANKDILTIEEQYRSGFMTQEERYNRVLDVWSNTNDQLADSMMETLQKSEKGFNNLHVMIDSGARGSKNQIRQLGGMRGLMAKPSGEIIELSIQSNFKEGLSVIEFFISTNGARKGLADTALKTSDAGYLTRRLVDIAQDVVINMEDCGTINGLEMRALKEDEGVFERLADRIRGRFTLERVRHPISGELIVDVNQEITDETAELIEDLGIESVYIRTVLTCEAPHGVCQKCYGRSLSSNKTVEIGEAVGVIAAQSIGQPGTQLTMRTFHIGGAATKISEENKAVLPYDVYVHSISGNTVLIDDGRVLLTRRGELAVTRVFVSFETRKDTEIFIKDGEKITKGQKILRDGNETVHSKENSYAILQKGFLHLVAQNQILEIRNGAELFAKEGDIIRAGEPIAIFDLFSEPIICEYAGIVRFQDVFPGTTLQEVVNSDTGIVEKIITEYQTENLQPRLLIEDENANELMTYPLPNNAFVNVEDGEKVKPGALLAKLPKESLKTRDITGGLPRVGELFEARHPHQAAVLAQITGTVSIGAISKGYRTVSIADEYGKKYEHQVPMGRHLFVRDGDNIRSGDKLCEGTVDVRDVLSILGENALQSFLVNEIQEIYRLQGVNINDKHIGIIIRQMMRKVEIVYTGDTKFIIGQHVDKPEFQRVNQAVVSQGGQSAVARPFLQGITRASLNIESFISAASFQETAKVLSNAAIRGAIDYLRGLKENVIIGHLIPAGTGMLEYGNLTLSTKVEQDLDNFVDQMIEKKKIEIAEAEAAAEQEVAQQFEPIPINDFPDN